MSTPPPGRPKEVLTGVALVSISLVAALLQLILNVVGFGNMPSPPPRSLSLYLGVWLLVQISLVWLSYRGKNWARILVALVVAIAMTNIGAQMQVVLASNFHPSVLISTITFALAPLGAICLFLPKSNAWFAAVKVGHAAA